MFCTNCGSKLPDDALFCPECGAQVITDDTDFSKDTDKSTTDLPESSLSDTDVSDDDMITEVIPEGERTVILNAEEGLDQDAVNAGDQTVVLGSAAQDIPREDTQAVFNDIQESLAHPDIDFEHTQTLGSDDIFSSSSDEMESERDSGPYNNMQESGYSDPGFNGEYGGADHGAMGNIPNGSYGLEPEGDGNDQKPKQQKKFWLILGLVSGGTVIAAVIIALVIMFTPSGRPSREYTEQIKQGEEYLSNSNYDDAIEAFRDAIQIDENQEDAYVGLADAYIKNQEYRKAAEVLQRGSKIMGNTEKIKEKKDELYETAPELESEFETESAKADPPQTQSPQASVPQTQAPQTQTPGTQAPQTQESQTQPPAVQEPDTNPGDTQTENDESSPSGPSDSGNVPDTSGSSTETADTSGSGETSGTPESGGETTETPGGGETAPQNPGDETENIPDSPGSSEGTPEVPSGDESPEGEILTMGSFKYQMKEYYKEQTLPDGSQAAYTQMMYPYFVDDTEGAKALNRYFENWIASLDRQEQTQYTGEESLTFPVYTKISVEMTYGENGFASMKYVTETYDGQSDPVVNDTGLIFNGNDGRQLSWSDVLYGTEDHLKELMTQYYDPSVNHDIPVEEYISRVSENLNNAYMTGDGIRFIAHGSSAAPDLEVLIPFSESSWFKFLSDTDPSQPAESETEPAAEGYSWIVEPSMELEDVAVIMDDTLRTQWVVSDQFPLAVYKKDGKLGFINYEGTTLTEPIYNCVYGCASNGDAYTVFASLAGNDIWSAAAVDPQSGQASGAVHAGHGGSEGVTVYSRSDQKLYVLSFDGAYETSNTTGSVLPVVVVDDIAQANYDEIIGGNGIYGLCSVEGTVDEGHLYDHIYTLSGGRMAARSGDKYGVIDEGGNVIIPFEYEGAAYLDMNAISSDPSSVVMTQDAPYPYSEGYIALKKDGMWGYFDVNGTCVTGMVFEEARPLNQNKAFVKQNGLWGIVEITAAGEGKE